MPFWSLESELTPCLRVPIASSGGRLRFVSERQLARQEQYPFLVLGCGVTVGLEFFVHLGTGWAHSRSAIVFFSLTKFRRNLILDSLETRAAVPGPPLGPVKCQ